jgi:hypothetical protein
MADLQLSERADEVVPCSGIRRGLKEGQARDSLSAA